MMSDQADNLLALLSPFGLEDDESRIYLSLLEKGELSALALSRITGLARSKVYRLLDKLSGYGLVQNGIHGAGMRFGATHPSKFSQLVTEKEHEIQSLKESLPEVLSQLETVAGRDSSNTKVLYYKGVEGIKQLCYNSLSAQKELLTYETTNSMTDFLPEGFTEEMRAEFVKRKIHIKELNWNKTYKPYTNVKDFALKYWETRYIDPGEFKIHSEALIYNDVYVLYNPLGPELFGVEIYNKDLAHTQRQLFHILWSHAKKMKVLSERGDAVLA